MIQRLKEDFPYSQVSMINLKICHPMMTLCFHFQNSKTNTLISITQVTTNRILLTNFRKCRSLCSGIRELLINSFKWVIIIALISRKMMMIFRIHSCRRWLSKSWRCYRNAMKLRKGDHESELMIYLFL